MSTTICKQFNLTLKEFTNDLLRMSNIKSLQILVSRINRLFSINICSTLIIIKFIQNVIPFSHLLDNSDSILFKKLIESESNYPNSNFFNLMVQLDKMWEKLPDDDKVSIFKYLKVLNFCAENYVKEHLKKK